MRATAVRTMLVGLVALALGAAQPGVLSTDAGPRATWAAERATLDPAQPTRYLDLAEVALASGDQPEAVRLFVLAAAIAAETGDNTTAASACLAVASLDLPDAPAGWVDALARTFDPAAALPAWRAESADSSGATWSLDDQAAAALAALRTGAMARYQSLMRDPAIPARLSRVPELQTVAGGADSVPVWLAKLADVWPCPTCHNEGVVRRRSGEVIEFALCPDCQGYPAPDGTLSPYELSLVLRAELRLLATSRTSWLADEVVTGAEPYRPPSVAALAARLGIDPALRVFRDGRWVAPDAGTPATIPAQG